MEFIGIKLSKEDKRKLEELMENRGMNVSELIRDLIRNSYDQHAAVDVLKEIKAIAGRLATHSDRSGNNQDIVEIRRIVTLMACAMPAVAKHI